MYTTNEIRVLIQNSKSFEELIDLQIELLQNVEEYLTAFDPEYFQFIGIFLTEKSRIIMIRENVCDDVIYQSFNFFNHLFSDFEQFLNVAGIDYFNKSVASIETKLLIYYSNHGV